MTMAILPLVEAPDPRLKQISTHVETITPEIGKLIDDMFETMYSVPGIGLAAIQVGVAKRIIVMDLSEDGEPPAPRCFINPEITWNSEEQASYREGCLSVPSIYADVNRPAQVRLTYWNREGILQEELAEGMFATCIQHEMDHLDGILFIDHFSNMQRNYFLEKLARNRQKKIRAREKAEQKIDLSEKVAMKG
jgi:peptide deformylase